MKTMNVMRFFILLVLILLLPVSLYAITIKIATAAPEGSGWMREMRAGATEIKQKTDGRVAIKFFAGGVMGNDKSVLRKMRVGQLHGGAFTTGSLLDITPDADLFSLPLIFRSEEEVDYIRSRMDADLKQAIENAGFANFGFAGGGFALLMSDKPARTIDDVRGLKIWVPEGDTISYRAMKSLGLAPVTLPITDVMTGLQAGLVEVIAASPIGALAFQWHTRIKYVTNTPLSYLYATMIIDKKFFNKITPADQKIVREVMDRIYVRIDRANRSDNEAARQAMIATGIAFVDSPEQEIARWRGVADNLVAQMRQEGAFSAELYDKMQSLLTEYRSGQVPAK
jgi:TRAP-type C4-dicarboxylate transport system substrate-binding protein